MDFERNTARDAEDRESFSDEDDEHSVENFMLCSSVHLACSPILEAFVHEEELCKVALTSSVVGRVVPLSGLSVCVLLEFSELRSIRPLLQHFLNTSPIMEGLQQ